MQIRIKHKKLSLRALRHIISISDLGLCMKGNISDLKLESGQISGIDTIKHNT